MKNARTTQRTRQTATSHLPRHRMVPSFCSCMRVVPGCAMRRARDGPLHPLLEGREEDHVADRLAARQHHREAVDAETEPTCGRHPIGERLDVVGVTLLGGL